MKKRRKAKLCIFFTTVDYMATASMSFSKYRVAFRHIVSVDQPGAPVHGSLSVSLISVCLSPV